MTIETAGRFIRPALIAAVSLAGFTQFEAIAALLFGTADLPGLGFARLLFGTVGYLALAWLVSRVVEAVLGRRMARNGTRPPRLLYEMIAALLFLAAFVAIAAFVFDGSPAGALATSGVLIAVVGFALRNTIADIVSGLTLSIERPFKIGDWIETEAGVAGKVLEITWRATRLESRDQVQVVLPNGRLAAGRLTNYSAPRRHYRVQESVTLDSRVSVRRAKELLTNAALAAPRIRRSPAPDVRVRRFAEHGTEYVVRYWVPSHADAVDCRDGVLESIDHHLRLAGVAMPQVRLRPVLSMPESLPAPANTSLVEVLERMPMLAGIGAAGLRVLAARGQIRDLPAGAAIGEADRAETAYLLVEGLATASPTDSAASMLGPGDLFSTVAAGGAGPVTAVTRLVLVEFPLAALREVWPQPETLDRLLEPRAEPTTGRGRTRSAKPAAEGRPAARAGRS